MLFFHGGNITEGQKKKKKISSQCEWPRAQSYQQKFSDMRNFHEKSENFKPKSSEKLSS